MRRPRTLEVNARHLLGAAGQVAEVHGGRDFSSTHFFDAYLPGATPHAAEEVQGARGAAGDGRYLGAGRATRGRRRRLGDARRGGRGARGNGEGRLRLRRRTGNRTQKELRARPLEPVHVFALPLSLHRDDCLQEGALRR